MYTCRWLQASTSYKLWSLDSWTHTLCTCIPCKLPIPHSHWKNCQRFRFCHVDVLQALLLRWSHSRHSSSYNPGELSGYWAGSRTDCWSILWRFTVQNRFRKSGFQWFYQPRMDYGCRLEFILGLRRFVL